jgi:hypothetical protein
MNEQYLGEDLMTTDIVEETDPGTNNPIVYSNPLIGNALVGAALIRETPMDETVAPEMSMDVTLPPEAPENKNSGSVATLLNGEESEHFRAHWNEIQGQFVDEPRSAVQQADALVSEVIGQITQMFANERSSLESQWNQGDDVSTEDLRKALQHYRSFFNRLVV